MQTKTTDTSIVVGDDRLLAEARSVSAAEATEALGPNHTNLRIETEAFTDGVLEITWIADTLEGEPPPEGKEEEQ
jgi:hypothetical protein